MRLRQQIAVFLKFSPPEDEEIHPNLLWKCHHLEEKCESPTVAEGGSKYFQQKMTSRTTLASPSSPSHLKRKRQQDRKSWEKASLWFLYGSLRDPTFPAPLTKVFFLERLYRYCHYVYSNAMQSLG